MIILIVDHLCHICCDIIRLLVFDWIVSFKILPVWKYWWTVIENTHAHTCLCVIWVVDWITCIMLLAFYSNHAYMQCWNEHFVYDVILVYNDLLYFTTFTSAMDQFNAKLMVALCNLWVHSLFSLLWCTDFQLFQLQSTTVATQIFCTLSLLLTLT